MMTRKNNVAQRELNDNTDHKNLLTFADEVKYFP